MTTSLDKTLKRALSIQGRDFVVAISPEALKLTLKGRRKGWEIRWVDLVSGDAALATALNASVGVFAPDPKRVLASRSARAATPGRERVATSKPTPAEAPARERPHRRKTPQKRAAPAKAKTTAKANSAR